MMVGGLPPFVTLLVEFYISLKYPAIIKYGGSHTGKVKLPRYKCTPHKNCTNAYHFLTFRLQCTSDICSIHKHSACPVQFHSFLSLSIYRFLYAPNSGERNPSKSPTQALDLMAVNMTFKTLRLQPAVLLYSNIL